MHRRLKEALKSRLKGPDLVDQLPWVLLGLRTEPREDLKASTVQLVYGAPIVIPGELVTSTSGEVEVSERLHQLRENIASLRPIPTTCHGERRLEVPADLMDTRFVLVRRGAHKSPLQAPTMVPLRW